MMLTAGDARLTFSATGLNKGIDLPSNVLPNELRHVPFDSNSNFHLIKQNAELEELDFKRPNCEVSVDDVCEVCKLAKDSCKNLLALSVKPFYHPYAPTNGH